MLFRRARDPGTLPGFRLGLIRKIIERLARLSELYAIARRSCAAHRALTVLVGYVSLIARAHRCRPWGVARRYDVLPFDATCAWPAAPRRGYLGGSAPHRFGQRAALVIADIARWRADQPATECLSMYSDMSRRTSLGLPVGTDAPHYFLDCSSNIRNLSECKAAAAWSTYRSSGADRDDRIWTRPDCRRNAAALRGSHSDDQLILINYQTTKARVILTAVNVPGFLACINA